MIDILLLPRNNPNKVETFLDVVWEVEVSGAAFFWC